jgi:hypothetical protein
MKHFNQNGGYSILYNQYFNFGHALFFVSPARHGEAQDMSGDLKQKKQNKNTYKTKELP